MSAGTDRREAYEALARGEHAIGERGTIVFCVYTTDYVVGRGDVFVAAGLGLELVERGYGVRLVWRGDWDRIGRDGDPGADVIVAMIPTTDPSLMPEGAWRIAWVRNEVDNWIAKGQLPAYHQVFASSQMMIDRIEKVTDRVHPEPLPIGADPELFRAPASERRRPSAVTTANFWGTVRDVHQVLIDLPRTADVELYGAVARAPRRLRRWHKGSLSYFDLPAVYGGATFVLDDVNKANVGVGALNSRLYESAACGALPVVNTGLGLADQGFGFLPTYHDADSLAAVLAELRADPTRTAALARRARETVLAQHTWAERAERFATAVDAARAIGDAPPGEPLYFFPDYWTNVFQDMLFGDLERVGRFPVPVLAATAHLHRALERPGGPGVFNIQWPDPILQPSPGPFSAQLALEEFTAAVAAYKQAGGRLIWTVHNVVPHEGKFRWAEAKLGQVLADHADVVHILSEQTIEYAAPHYRIDPDKCVLIEHSSYLGQYADWMSREGARRRLGLQPSERVLVTVGGVRPYKGLDRLVDVFEELSAQDPTLRLLIAGRPGKLARSAAFEQRCLDHPRIEAFFDFVPNDQLQVWMRAADLAVLPYRNILNSGSFQLAQTFGLPIVAPRSGALAAQERSPHVVLFDPEDDTTLKDAVVESLASFVTNVRGARIAAEASAAAAAAVSPERMAAQFADVVAEVGGR